jgi:hypothetical protein
MCQRFGNGNQQRKSVNQKKLNIGGRYLAVNNSSDSATPGANRLSNPSASHRITDPPAPARWAEPSDFRFWIFVRGALWIFDCGSKRQRKEWKILFVFVLLPNPKSAIQNPKWSHRITRSALAKTFGGIVKPICLAALRLITSSNLIDSPVGGHTGVIRIFGASLYCCVVGCLRYN